MLSSCRRVLHRPFTLALAACVCWAALALAQVPPNPNPANPAVPGQPAPSTPSGGKAPGPPAPSSDLHAFEHFLAILGAAAMLFVVCAPTSKRF